MDFVNIFIVSLFFFFVGLGLWFLFGWSYKIKKSSFDLFREKESSSKEEKEEETEEEVEEEPPSLMRSISRLVSGLLTYYVFSTVLGAISDEINATNMTSPFMPGFELMQSSLPIIGILIVGFGVIDILKVIKWSRRNKE